MTAARLPRPRISRLREFGASVSTIMSKELRSRFRGRRAFVVLTIYLAVLALIAYGAYVKAAGEAQVQAPFGGIGLDGSILTSANASAIVGQAIFGQLSIFQLLLVGFLAPAFTTGAISLEREKATLDLLITTPLRPGAIVIGKLFSALAFVLLMILAGIPVSALVLMYGGASAQDVLRQQAILLISAIGFGVIGLFCSALIKRTQTATVVAYSTVLFLTVGTLFIFRFWTAGVASSPEGTIGQVNRAPEALLYLNPAVAMIETVADTEITQGDFGKIMAEIRGQQGFTCNGDVCFLTDPGNNVGGGGVKDLVAPDCPPNARCAAPPAPAVFDPQPVETGHFLPRFALSFGALAVVLTVISMRLVVPAGLAFSFRRRRAVPEPVR